MPVKVKRIYDPPEPEDGVRVLVERLWPRGVKRERAKVDLWLREVAPSPGLRRWFAHDPAKWEEFKRRYWGEIGGREAFRRLAEMASRQTVTLLYSARSPYNNAVALKEFLERGPPP